MKNDFLRTFTCFFEEKYYLCNFKFSNGKARQNKAKKCQH